jgi:IS30 family transposase
MSPDGFVERDERIWAMRAQGFTFQEIADAVGCGLATVDRALKRLAARMADDEDEDFVGPDAALAQYDGLRCEDVTKPEQVAELNALELFRLGHLPPDHPARVWR